MLRTYTTRHGPGPLVTEDPALALAEPHNPTTPGRARSGSVTSTRWPTATRSRCAGGVDALALTHLDMAGPRRSADLPAATTGPTGSLPGPPGDLDRQEALTARLLRTSPVYDERAGRLAAAVARELDAPVVLTSHGPTADDKTPHGPLLAPRPLAHTA